MLSWVLLLSQVVWIPSTTCVYHELSMQVFEPPDKPSALPSDALFGYSVTYQSQKRKRLVISAPKADNVGQVFSCDIDTKVCSKIDVLGSTVIRRDNKGITYNHDFWLGASVKASSSFLVICAPRFSDRFRGMTKYGTFGRCYKQVSDEDKCILMSGISYTDRLKGFTQFENLTDSFGWSLDIGSDDTVLVGSPAMSSGRVMVHTDVTTPTLINGRDAPETVAYNFGYSVASGYFSTNPKQLVLAIGTPYGEFGNGKVLIYDRNGKTLLGSLTEKEPEVGYMFGATLCAARLTGKHSALLVGAPGFATGLQYDVGAVYVYVFTLRQLKLKRTIAGNSNGGYFGSAMANIGDLNGDQKDEVAISAPYEDGVGAVYIYSGADLISHVSDIQWLQRIQPSPAYRSFGLSLTALQDYDENGCNELGIGAPVNNSVILMKCMASVTVSVDSILPNLQKRTDKKSFVFQSCLNAIYPDKPVYVIANITIKVEIVHPNAKLAFPHESDYTISLESKQPSYCRNITVLTPLEGDYNQAIEYAITAKLLDDPTLRPDFEEARVILSDRSSLTHRDRVWASDCKTHGECTPNLDFEIFSTISNPYIIGSTEAENVTVRVRNTGEVAYDACVRAQLADSQTSVLSAPGCARDHTGMLACAPRTPLQSNTFWETNAITLQMDSLTSQDENIKIVIYVYNYCKKTKETKSKQMLIPLLSDSNGIVLDGMTDRGNLVNISRSEAQNRGKQIEHTYTIINSGVTNWVDLKCDIVLEKKDYLLYSSIRVYSEKMKYSACDLNKDKESANTINVTCKLGDLHKKNKIHVFVPIEVLPGDFATLLETENATATTSFHLYLHGDDKSVSVTSTIRLRDAKVPLWILLLAAIVGLLLLLLIAFALYECGFLRRKNKENLKVLKRSVKRQSMRRSMMLQNARLATDGSHLQSLVEHAEEVNSEGGNDAGCTNAVVEKRKINKKVE